MQVTSSNEYPEQFQLLQGKKLINIDVIESTTEVDGESLKSYSYTQLSVDVNADTELSILKYRADVSQQYLDSTDLYMTVDKHAQLTQERQIELTDKRESARIIIREYRNAISN
jgi:hypothetical protein